MNLIDKDKILYHKDLEDNESYAYKSEIDAIPTIDTPSVVFCKYCKNRNACNNPSRHRDIFYCAWGA